MKNKAKEILKTKLDNVDSVISEILKSLRPRVGTHVSLNQQGQSIYNLVYSDIKAAFNTKYGGELASEYIYQRDGNYSEKELIDLLTANLDEMRNNRFKNSFQLGRRLSLVCSDIRALCKKDKHVRHIYA